MGKLKKYLDTCKKIRKERGEFCEGCGVSAKHLHHIIPVSETSIHSDLFYNEANLIILCDNCHSLCHPLLRNISNWKKARIGRGRALI